MKMRFGFVSNSSSSSFVVKLSDLTEEQIGAIKNHIEYSISNREELYGENDFDDTPWTIQEKDAYLFGDTMMDNFDFYYFLTKIGVDMKKVQFWDSNGNYNDDGQRDE